MATRNERKRKAKALRIEMDLRKIEAATAKDVRQTVKANLASPRERNFYPESLMGSLKSMGTSGRVVGLSRLAPLPDASGKWWEHLSKQQA